jgi:acetylglutamate kinase
MDKLLIIKIGGNVIDDEQELKNFLQKFSSLPQKKILVHGGGKMATQLADKLNINQTMVEGRRVTDAETLKLVTMVYAGEINKKIVAGLQSNNCNALGLTGADGNIILAHKRKGSSIDYGYAGDIDSVQTGVINSLLASGFSIVIAPITHDKKGQLLNTNADTIAQEIAKSFSDEYEVHLVYCFEKEGVLLDMNSDESVVPHLNSLEFDNLKKEEKIFDGMIPKLDNAFTALAAGVNRITLGKASKLEELITGKAGTTITNE